MANVNWHEDFIIHLVKVIRPKVYVELGIQRCLLFNRVIDHAEKLIGVDIDKMAGSYMSESPKAQFFHGPTTEFAKKLEADPLEIDLLFIDADHSKEAVLEDFKNYFPFVAPHGLILLHDGHPGSSRMMDPLYCGTAYQAIEELSKQTDAYEMMTIPVSPGLTLCRKRKEQLSWHEKKE
ncbi:class I SAM-dependent methyltransferase [Halobacillus massiliensis]|uniref:class I SAM-dependent methyltransferase n=1 Tax=Halobacillus massiliensis TaxID=1926286 RepID=UPI001179E17C|nr:class I SAM-dependent methyltransferase [Halobacillus massiliensis]